MHTHSRNTKNQKINIHIRNHQKNHDHIPMDSKKIFTNQGFTAELQRVKEKIIKTEDINDSEKNRHC